LNNLHIAISKLRKVVWVGYVASMRERKEMHTKFRWENMKLRNQWEDVGTDGRILKWLLKKYVGRVWAGLCIRIGTSGRIL
jgi:hypothetical protein